MRRQPAAYLFIDHGPIRYWIGPDSPINRRRQAKLRRLLTTWALR